VAALRDYAAKFNHPIVVVLAIGADFETFEVVSYGKTRELCASGARLADGIHEAVESGAIKR
jgi:hypothetical protein